MKMGKVSFGGVAKEVCMAYVPEVQPGEYVVVHAGFALNVLDEEEATEVFNMLQEMEALADLETSE
jgi:hydrogenase expression/formation protein HypC